MKTRRLQMDKQREKERKNNYKRKGIMVSEKYRNIKKTEKKKEI